MSFGKCASAAVSLAASWYLEGFSDEIDGDPDKYNLSLLNMKWINSWKICITQWTNTFQRTDSHVIKLHINLKIYTKYEAGNGFQCDGLCKVHWYESDSTLQLTFKKWLLIHVIWKAMKVLYLFKLHVSVSGSFFTSCSRLNADADLNVSLSSFCYARH